jgi:hypothetical protein
MQRHVLAPSHAHPDLQAVEAIESPHTLAIDRPTCLEVRMHSFD